MKQFLLSAFLLAALSGRGLQAQNYVTVPLTGFTADIVANGPASVASSTSIDMDGASFALVAQNYVSPSNATPTSALPNSGTINSAATSGLTFQLASYTANNSLRIAAPGTGTLTFGVPQSADQIYVLATSGSGASTATFTVNFTDNTTQVFTQTVNDWFGGAGFAIQGISRVSRATDAIENNATNPRLYQYLLTLSAANTTKTIQSITFNKTSTAGVLNVMGVSVRSVPSTLATDAGVLAISAPNSGCLLTNQETITISVKNYGTTAQSNIPVSYTLNNGTPVSEVIAGPVAANTTTTYSFTTKANLSTAGTYNLTARTNLTGDLLAANDAASKTVTISTTPATPTIAASGATTLCTSGVVVLTATSATPGATFQWFNNGVAIPTGTAANYAVTSPGSYSVVASTTGCNSAASAATTVTQTPSATTPTVTAGGPTSFCNGGSVTLTAATGTSGATYLWFQNGTVIPGVTSATYTANTSGSYTALATINGCGSATSTPVAVTVSVQPATPTITQNGAVLTSSSNTGNQWYKNGAIITGAINRTYTPTTNGAYTVVVSTSGCSSTASSAVTITAAGIEDEVGGMAISVYPNPSNGTFNLKLPQVKNALLTVTDLSGKVVKKQTATGPETTLHFPETAKGIYILQIVSEGKTAVRKLIVE